MQFDDSPDSIPALLQNSGGRRELSGSFTLDPSALLDQLIGQGPEEPGSTERRSTRELGSSWDSGRPASLPRSMRSWQPPW